MTKPFGLAPRKATRRPRIDSGVQVVTSPPKIEPTPVPAANSGIVDKPIIPDIPLTFGKRVEAAPRVPQTFRVPECWWPVYGDILEGRLSCWTLEDKGGRPRVGDILEFTEYDPEARGPTGRALRTTVTYTLRDAPMVPKGWTLCEMEAKQ